MEGGGSATGMIRFTESYGYYFGGYIGYRGNTNDFVIGMHNSPISSATYDKDILSIARTDGRIDFYPQTTTEYGKTLVTWALDNHTENYVVYYNNQQTFCVRGGGHVYHTGITDLSDISVKENISDIADARDLILQLNPVSFNYKFDSVRIGDKSKLEFGLIAQEVEEIIPCVVDERSDGLKGVNYNEITALLIATIQSQQAEIELLNTELNSLIANYKKGEISSSSEVVKSTSVATLFQNSPNPFDNETVIKYYIPIINSKALINVYNLQGKQLKCFELSDSGESELIINGAMFEPGIYIYNLIVDGRIVDSKRMILTD